MEHQELSDEYIEELVTKELESMQIDIEELDGDDTKNDIYHIEQNYQISTEETTNIESDEEDLSDVELNAEWQKYEQRANEYLNQVDEDLLESERLLERVQSSYLQNKIVENEEEFSELDDNEDTEEIEVNAEDETLEIEKELKQKLKELDEEHKQKDLQRIQVEAERKKQIEIEMKESEMKWELIQEKLLEEKEKIELKKRQIDESHNKMISKEQRAIDRNLEILKLNLEEYTRNFEDEKRNLVNLEREKVKNISQRQNKAATKIQKYFRGYRVRKVFGPEVKRRVEEAKEKFEEQRILQYELQQKYEEERLQRIEEEKKKKLEMEMKRLKEQQEFELHMEMMRLQQIEEEKRRLEEEKLELARQEESYRKSLQMQESDRKSENEMDKNNNDLKIEREMLNRKENDESEVELADIPVAESPKSATENHQEDNKLSNLDETHDDDDDVIFNNDNYVEAPKIVADKVKVASEIIKEEKILSEKVEEEKKVAEVEVPQMDILKVQLFNEWKKHNSDYMFKKIKEEHLIKNQQKDEKDKEISKNTVNQIARVRSARLKDAKPIPDNVLLKNASKSKLSDINYLSFKALPVYSLETLQLCTNLTFLTINDSQISSLDSLHDCVNLKYINAQENKIEWLDLRNLPKLVYLNLAKNQLTSVQNLSDCHNLRYLNLSFNKLTRLGFLNPNFTNLQYLNVSNNQLLNTIGLSNCIQLQFLDLSLNNLNTIQDLESLALLLEINASKNNLLHVPSLVNQILIMKINLNDNNISSMNAFSSYWMPLLKEIELNRNRIEQICLLEGLFNIEKLFLDNNNLFDSSSVKNIEELAYVHQVSVKNNPLINEDSIDLANFEFLNEDTICVLQRKNNDAPKLRDSDLMLRKNIKTAQDLLSEKEDKVKKFIEIFQSKEERAKKAIVESELINKLTDFEDELDKFRDLSIVLREAIEANDSKLLFGKDENLKKLLETCSINDSKVLPKLPSRPTSNTSETGRVFSARLERIKAIKTTKSSQGESETNSSVDIRNESENLTEIELYVRYLQKKFKIELLNQCAVKIQSNWKGYKARKEMDREAINMAAILIQAHWRGFSVRKRIKEAKEKLFNNNELDFEEIDLNQFEYDESKFDVKVESTAQRIPLNVAQRKLNSEDIVRIKPPKTPLAPIAQAKQAWRNADSNAPTPNLAFEENRYNVLPLTSQRSLNSGTNSDFEILTSSKHEKVANDWGFKDHRTAELMLQRAEKMKYKVERKNKLKSLDPKQRLALLRKFDKFTPRVTTNRNGTENGTGDRHVVNARNFEIVYDVSRVNGAEVIGDGDKQGNLMRTYKWVHTQVKDLPETPRSESYETKIPKLPQLKHQERRKSSNSGSGSSNAHLDKVKPVNMYPSALKNQLPPLSHVSKNYFNNESKYDEEYSLASSRSSFTQFFFNNKTDKNNKNSLLKKKNKK